MSQMGQHVINGVVLEAGHELPPLDVGPFILSDFVRWAAYQENWIRLHYDGEYAVQHGFPGIIQSGNHRTALIIRMLTDWLGGHGQLKRLTLSHSAVVLAGDSIRCGARIRDTGTLDEVGRAVHLDVWARNQRGQDVSTGRAVVYLRGIGG